MNTHDMSTTLPAPLATEIALLGFLRNQPLHGYEIYRRLSEAPELKAVWRMKQSRLYAILSRLEVEGLIQSTHEPQDNRPPRKVFHLTAAGESAFRRWLIEPVRLPREMRLDFMLKLFFALEDGQRVAAELIRRQLEVCARWLVLQEEKDSATNTYLDFVRGYRQAHIEAIQNWLAALADEISHPV